MKPTPWWHGAIMIGASVLYLLVTTPKQGFELANRIGLACVILAGAGIIIEAIRYRSRCRHCGKQLNEFNSNRRHAGECCSCVDEHGGPGH